MVFLVLVYWIVKQGFEKAFIATWKKLSMDNKSALVGEFLSKVELPNGLNTWDLTVEGASTFVNVGIWKSKDDFVEQIGKYISTRKDFEKKFRVRAILTPILQRRGKISLESAIKELETVE